MSIDIQKFVRVDQHLRKIDHRGGSRRIDTRRQIGGQRRLGFSPPASAAVMIGICLARKSERDFLLFLRRRASVGQFEGPLYLASGVRAAVIQHAAGEGPRPIQHQIRY